MIDTYSKIVLTIIAAALSALAVQQAVKPANALVTLEREPCGRTYLDPCWVKVTD